MQNTILVSELLNNQKLTVKQKTLYSKIWKDLNGIIVDKAIQDTVVDFPLFGTLKLVRKKPVIKILPNGILTLRVNWGATNKARKEGVIAKDKLIFCKNTDRIVPMWHRPNVKNIKCYSFRFSRTNGTASKTGFINKIIAHLNECDTNYLRFPLKK